MEVQHALEILHIDYVTTGKNVSSGNINIKCPWCTDDPSEHLGIDTTTGVYGCWRDPSHSGKDAAYALARASNTSIDAVRALLAPAPPDNMTEATKQETHKTPASVLPPVTFPPIGCFPILDSGNERFVDYLFHRGIRPTQQAALRFSLYGGRFGPMAHRLVIPVRDVAGNVVAYTGRSLGSTKLRYLSQPYGPAIKRCLLFEDQLIKGGDILCVTEGPFDAMTVDWHGRWSGIRGTCIFGMIATSGQIRTLASLSSRYRKVVVMLDKSAWGNSIKLAEAIPASNVQTFFLSHRKDPGEMTEEEVVALGSL
jgi:hypothetical protein